MTTVTRTECAVLDMIVRWSEVQTGDLVVLDNALVIAEEVQVVQKVWDSWTGETFPAVDIRHQLDNGCFVVNERHGDGYTAVRRYVETPAGQEG